jgi:hypothetical protein
MRAFFQKTPCSILLQVQRTITLLIVLQTWLLPLQGFLADRFGRSSCRMFAVQKSLARALDPARDNPPDEVAFSQERALGNAPAGNPAVPPEIGGWLSHTAIMAREYNVAMIVGTRGLSRVTDGSLL